MPEFPSDPPSMTRIFGRSAHRKEPTFRDKWLEAVRLKNSVLCAGLDPAEFTMGRGDDGLRPDDNKLDWALRYVDAVAPFVAAVKYNVQYWRGAHDGEALQAISSRAHKHGLVLIEDAKLADIGSTNDAGMFYAALRADAVTVAPFAGNLEEAAQQAKERELGLIAMCLMSNPGYEQEKIKLVPVKDRSPYRRCDFVFAHVPQYIVLAHEAHEYGCDGIVVGAPSPQNHITPREIASIRHYAGSDMLVLLLGVGTQSDEARSIWKHFDRDNVIVNVGRALMFPLAGTYEEVARYYRDRLNTLRETPHALP